MKSTLMNMFMQFSSQVNEVQAQLDNMMAQGQGLAIQNSNQATSSSEELHVNEEAPLPSYSLEV